MLLATRTGKPLLMFKRIVATLGVQSERAAQCRYRRKVGIPERLGIGHRWPP
ncbi:hypothetical protein [Streptomyces sp. NPDC005435]|uniref:hypothetical protein n=1 Tax=Streptomyces sp. NPDC005435 TaxID=3154464 RepID=UPI003454EB6D